MDDSDARSPRSPVSAVRGLCTAAVLLGAAVVIGYCLFVGMWVLSTAGSPDVSAGDVLWWIAGLGVLMLLAIAAVLIQLRWANRATRSGIVALRSLLALAGPGAVILVFAWAAWP